MTIAPKIFVFAYPGLITWDDAEAQAELLGGTLASITSSAENALVVQYFHGLSGWVGGYQPDGSTEPAGDWTWISGTENFTYTNWAAGQPDNSAAGENKIEVLTNGTWTDVASGILHSA